MRRMEQFEVQPLYRALVENAQDILGVLTAGGQIVTISPAVRRVLGLAPERLRGRYWVDQVHPDDRSQCRHWLTSCLADDARHQRIQLRAGRPPQWHVLELSGVAVPEDAYTQRIVFSARDVTDEVRANALLAEREARFRSAFHDAPIGKVLLDAQGRIVDSNRAFADIVGRWSSELERADFLALFASAEGHDVLRSALQAARAEPSPEVALTLDRRGRPAHLRVMFAAVAAEGEAQVMAQVQDLTARIEAERALERNLQHLRLSNRRLQEMAWMASHDLKEPLRGIVGSLQLIVRRHGDSMGEAERQTAAQAIAQAKTLREKLDGLEREVGSSQDAERVMLPFGELLSEWAQVHAGEIQQNGVQIQSEDLPSFRADRRVGGCFQSVLDQALAWAVESAGSFPLLTVRGQWQDRQWRLVISFPAPRRLQAATLIEPGGALFGLRSEVVERGADLQLQAADGQWTLWLDIAPD